MVKENLSTFLVREAAKSPIARILTKIFLELVPDRDETLRTLMKISVRNFNVQLDALGEFAASVA